MSQYRNILVIADPEHPGSNALRRAGALAKATGATLHLRSFVHHAGIHAAGLLNADVGELARKELVRERQAWLEREADSLRGTGATVRAEVVWGRPLRDKIVEAVHAVRPDLVLKDVQAEPGLRRLLFQPLDWHLLRVCPAPLLLVGARSGRLPQRIVAAVDTAAPGGEAEALNADIVRAALELAALCGAPLEVVHAFEGLPPIARGNVDGPAMMATDIHREIEQSRARNFKTFAERLNIAPEHRHFRVASPEVAITELVAETGSDVVVMGTLSGTPLERVFIGSTAERVLDSLNCDVLAVKPRRYAEAAARRHEPKAA